MLERFFHKEKKSVPFIKDGLYNNYICQRNLKSVSCVDSPSIHGNLKEGDFARINVDWLNFIGLLQRKEELDKIENVLRVENFSMFLDGKQRLIKDYIVRNNVIIETNQKNSLEREIHNIRMGE